MKAELLAACEIVGEAATPSEAIAVIAATKSDVVLLDVHLPDGGGVAVLRALEDAEVPPAVLALSVSDAAEDVVPMIRAGALGYVTKTIHTAELALRRSMTRRDHPETHQGSHGQPASVAARTG